MEEKKISVQMLGDFSLLYDGKAVTLERSSITKATQLLEYLIYNRGKKIPRSDLIRILYESDDISNPANNLKVNLFRLRKLLSASHLPEDDYISFKSGMYSFNSQTEIEVDAEVFENFVLSSKDENISDEEKLILLQRAISMYRGEFLPMLSNKPWVVVENVKYSNLYKECITEACKLLKEIGDLGLRLDICNRAVHIYPFDEEMRLLRISCLIDMKRYEDALVAYDETRKMFFEELGVAPSQKMLSLYKQMTNNVKLSTSTIEQIKEALLEREKTNGAYYCNYLGFIDSYRFIARVIERNGQSIFLSLFTITNIHGDLLEPGEKLRESADALHDVICDSLRRGDLYTRYSPNQFLVLLVGINYENCALVSDRINAKFKYEKRIRGVKLSHSVTSGADIDTVDSKMKFANVSLW